MLSFPNAKINLGLNVVSKRADGYHNIESIFYPLPITDVLECIQKDPSAKNQLSISFSGDSIPGDARNNLVTKAFDLLAKTHQLGKIDAHLIKTIPMGAGLGGGSADGTFMLRLIKDVLQLPLSTIDLQALAIQLGSDCPFFLFNEPALVEGRGEIVNPIALSLKGYHFVLIHPGIHISTAEAYSNLKPEKSNFDLAQIVDTPIHDWKIFLRNDFEKPIFKLYPSIENIKKELYTSGAIYAQMSGSGSAVFGIFETLPQLNIDGDYSSWTGIFK